MILVRLCPDNVIVSFARLYQTQIEPSLRFDGTKSVLYINHMLMQLIVSALGFAILIADILDLHV